MRMVPADLTEVRQRRHGAVVLQPGFAQMVAEGKFPVMDCPRCVRHDLRIAAPDWAICQTCGFQTDRPDLPAGVLTPRNMNVSMVDIKERLGQRSEK